jgi:hypothetical protein
VAPGINWRYRRRSKPEKLFGSIESAAGGGGGGGDERGEAAFAGGGLFGGDDVVEDEPTVAGRLGLEKCPSGARGAEFFREQRRQCGLGFAFEGVDAGLRVIARGEGGEAGGVHESRGGEAGDVRDIDVAPNAAGFARGEAVRIAVLVDFSDDAIDPTEAKCLIHGFRVSQADEAGGFFVGPDVEFPDGGVVFFKPGAKVGGGIEKSGRQAVARKGEGGRFELEPSGGPRTSQIVSDSKTRVPGAVAKAVARSFCAIRSAGTIR